MVGHSHKLHMHMAIGDRFEQVRRIMDNMRRMPPPKDFRTKGLSWALRLLT